MTKIELVIVPIPEMGHLLSMVEFAKHITQTNPNISILVVIFHMSLFKPTKINSYIHSQSTLLDPTRISFLTLPPLSNPPDPSNNPNFFVTAVSLQSPLLKQAVQDRNPKPAAFVLDFINVSMVDVANELNVPSYIYFTAGVNFLYTMFQFQALADEHGVEDVTGLVGDPNNELDLSGFRNRVPVKVIPYWMFLDKDSAWPKYSINLARRFREVKGILVNSFVDLESSTIKALNEMDNIPTIYPVGPVLSLNNRGDSKSSNNSNNNVTDDEESIISWLDGQPESSVVFLCFGSMGCFDADQVKEIANGLDQSGHRFLWSLRKPIQVESSGAKAKPRENEIFEEALPEGFIERTVHKGKIIPWAPQVTVLAHKAIGGFVSHCGWNSILESMWYGVPIATWPMYSEQQLNAFTLVKELELAVEVKLDYRWNFKKVNYLVTAEEVEESVRKVMNLDDEMRRKVQEMSEKCRKVKEVDGGSSYESLTRFIKEVTRGHNIILS